MYARIAGRFAGDESCVRTTLPWISLFSTCFHSERKMATLAYEEIDVKPSEEEEAAASNADRSFRAIILHGLMGSGRNWKNFSRQLGSAILQRSPPGSAGWHMVLVDLRNHGQSAGLEGFDPPHDISSAAKDVANLVKAEKWDSPDVVIGHSMGGKVALDFAESCSRGDYGDSFVLPKELWVLDSVPGEVETDDNGGEVEKVLTTMKFLPNPIPSRRWLVEYMMNLGFSKTLSDWLGSNLKRVNTSSEEVTWVFDLDGIVEMFNSYRKKSYWSLLQHPPQRLEISIVRAENSDRWNSAVLSQLESVANKDQSADDGRVFYQVLKNAGHWVHIDNPKGLIDIMAPSMARLSSS